ncbi:MAG: transcriptional regulator [Kibdelosporangium sp.]
MGFSFLPRVASAAGLPESEVESELIDLAVAGLVTRVPGEFGGWGLTDAGRAADAGRIADELAASGARPVVAEVFEKFLVLNPELLDLCTAWQTRSAGGAMTPNDHTDPAYDARVLDRFVDFHQRAEAACGPLFAALTRFERYQIELTHALNRARSGEPDYLTDNMASYHSVWFQLHEDLLTTLGIPRH